MSNPSETATIGMLKQLAFFLFISTSVGLFGIIRNLDFYEESSYSDPAAFQVPGAKINVILERRHIHLFLAEYERTLVLRVDGKEVLRHGVAVDTGGYSRMNIFQVSAHKYVLIGQLDFDRYVLDISQISLSKLRDQRLATGGIFVGSFDRDNKGWRFIPVSERGIQKGLTDQY